MKKVHYIFLVCLVALGMASCKDNQFTDTIYVDPVEKTDVSTRVFDEWLLEHFTKPYNVEFIYRLDDNSTDPSYNIVPVSLGMADTVAHVALYLWYDVYDQVVGKEFLPTYGPKMLQLIGSAMINAAQGTEKLGYAEGGNKITLLKINAMETDNMEQMNEYIFKTMHHEFAHILHQQRAYPIEFALINPGDYDPNRWQDRTVPEALQLGFITPYASSQAREDFVETIANYIVKSDAEWSNSIKIAGEDGAAIINLKLDMCRTYLQDKWGIDLEALHREVQTRQETLDWDKVMHLKFLKK